MYNVSSLSVQINDAKALFQVFLDDPSTSRVNIIAVRIFHMSNSISEHVLDSGLSETQV